MYIGWYNEVILVLMTSFIMLYEVSTEAGKTQGCHQDDKPQPSPEDSKHIH